MKKASATLLASILGIAFSILALHLGQMATAQAAGSILYVAPGGACGGGGPHCYDSPQSAGGAAAAGGGPPAERRGDWREGRRGGFRQRRVVPVRPGGVDAQRYAGPVAGQRAFQAALAPVHRRRPGPLTAAGALVRHPSTVTSPSSRPMIWS